MKHYEIVLNGQVYQITLKEINQRDGEALETAPKSAMPTASGGVKVEAPMAGIVVSMNVQKGARVAKGQALMMLEAMKMENEIVSPVDGIVSEILVTAGQGVDSGQVMITI